MAYSRIFGILDLELTRHVAFCFSIAENLDRPGSSTVRPNERFRFEVWAINNSEIPLKTVQGEVRSTSLTEFPTTGFRITDLHPHQREPIATIEGRVIRNPGKGCLLFHQIGVVTASLSPDLSRYRVEKSRPLTYVKSA